MWAQDSQNFLPWCLVCWGQLRPRCGFTHGPRTRWAPGKPSLCPEPSDCFSVPFTGGTQLHVAVTRKCTGLTFAPRPPAVFSLPLQGPPAQPCPGLFLASVDPEIWIRADLPRREPDVLAGSGLAQPGRPRRRHPALCLRRTQVPAHLPDLLTLGLVAHGKKDARATGGARALRKPPRRVSQLSPFRGLD